MRDCGGVAGERTAAVFAAAGRAGGGREAGAVYNRDLIVSRDLGSKGVSFYVMSIVAGWEILSSVFELVA
jgi:hypothetical protein